jgi:hypothetical protein
MLIFFHALATELEIGPPVVMLISRKAATTLL